MNAAAIRLASVSAQVHTLRPYGERSILDDYGQIMSTFGYVTLFGVLAPQAAIVAFVITLVQVCCLTDTQKTTFSLSVSMMHGCVSLTIKRMSDDDNAE